MICKYCRYKVRTSYEYGDYECQFFGENAPKEFEKYDEKTDELGCELHYQELLKLCRLKDEEYEEYFKKLLKKYKEIKGL